MYTEKELKLAFEESIAFTKNHYENFPVLSLFVPKHLRKSVAVIYKFARMADDIADEGNASPEQRMDYLEKYESHLNNCLAGVFDDTFWFALKTTIDNHNLSTQNFLNLLKAFKQDIVKKRYDTFAELMAYCNNSADPVGRLILELHGIQNEDTKLYSDKICTALQITNFIQDIGVDWNNGRIYIPSDEMIKFGITENEFDKNKNNDKFRELVKYQVDRAKIIFDEGRTLLGFLKGALKYQIAWTIFGGETILNKIEKINYDTRKIRPTITKIDLLKLIILSWKI
ncbi:MAG: squalene synthase HpnC [Ignavibacteriae bacterium HGW-Ignavibacteriae-2]|jgi:squalene synthase HpnC|nr:MAG: squalene synthase HpnC [Ignavibacteriae bacterium HGW-Ignavibacteriae-2]